MASTDLTTDISLSGISRHSVRLLDLRRSEFVVS